MRKGSLFNLFQNIYVTHITKVNFVHPLFTCLLMSIVKTCGLYFAGYAVK